MKLDMAAAKGNQLWKLRSKHGSNKLFSSASLLWEAACEYFQWVDDNPFLETKAMSVSNGMNAGSEIKMVEIPVKRPYTLHGLCIYFNCTTDYFRSFKSQERLEKEDFITVIKQIEQVIYNQKFEGAASGFFNANIIARDLGLKEQTEVDVNDNRKQIADMFKDILPKAE